jgi:enterochelin esterase-like enzyme
MKTVLSALLASQFCVWSAFAQQPCKSTVVGNLHIGRFQSKMYGESFKVRVWLPRGYKDAENAKRKYPTLYLLDGQTAFDECTAFHGELELLVD